MKICSVQGCRATYYATGYCARHYKQTLVGRDPHERRRCGFCNEVLSLEATPTALFCNGSCKMKWHRRHGCYTDDAVRASVGACSVDGCDGAVHSHGLCRRHDSSRWRGLRTPSPAERAAVVKKVLAWRRKYPHKNRALHAKRRAEEIQAAPKWLTRSDWKEMAAMYGLAHKMSKETGIVHHVDHVVPLCGRNVCGLHIPINLQVLPASENMRKHNKFVPDP